MATYRAGTAVLASRLLCTALITLCGCAATGPTAEDIQSALVIDPTKLVKRDAADSISLEAFFSITHYSTEAGSAHLKDGPELLWDMEGRLRSSGRFRNGRRTGWWIAWHANGTRASETCFLDGKMTGQARTWSEDGTLLFDFSTKEDRRDGPYSEYDFSGWLKMTGFYENGSKCGIWTIYRAAGRIWKSGKMKGDRMIGIWRTWNEDGTLVEVDEGT